MLLLVVALEAMVGGERSVSKMELGANEEWSCERIRSVEFVECEIWRKSSE